MVTSRLTTDHKPCDPHEASRIEALGGKVGLLGLSADQAVVVGPSRLHVAIAQLTPTRVLIVLMESWVCLGRWV